MTLRRSFLGIGACALMLLGLSTNASATITGTGCIVSGNTGQSAPTSGTINSAASFLSACNTANGGTALTFTFTTTSDNITVNSGGTGPATLNQILTGSNVTCINGTANCATTTATSGSSGGGGFTSWFDFHYTLGTALSGTPLNVTQHDDGVSLFVNGAIQTPTNQTITQAAQPQSVAGPTNYTVTAAMGSTVDLIWAECCGLPGVLTVNLPGEAPTTVPEPGSIILLGTTILGIAGFLKRRIHV